MGLSGWRLLRSGPAPGRFNMALDEAIMECHSGPPTLRLYSWSPPCLSLGYFQSARSDVDLEACTRLGIDLVRRPTGGRAILHDDELTYCVVGPIDHPHLSGSVNESYGKIAGAVAEGLRTLGVEVEGGEVAGGLRGKAESGACFEAVWGHELAVHGRKLVASAQTRRGGVLLQHGSILLSADAGKLASLLKTRDGGSLEAVLRRRLATLSGEMGRNVSAGEAASAIQGGFERALGVTLEVGEPSAQELAQAVRLVAEKYGNASWTLRR